MFAPAACGITTSRGGHRKEGVREFWHAAVRHPLDSAQDLPCAAKGLCLALKRFFTPIRVIRGERTLRYEVRRALSIPPDQGPVNQAYCAAA